MQLSNRLQSLTDLVTRGNRVADIGCDHAYVSIYLMEQGIASHVIAMDINKGPLERAKENIRKYGFCDKIETRLSNGAEKLEVGEVDTIFIAGMGGALIRNILSAREEVIASCKELILSPQSEIHLVRMYLKEIGFHIVKENMLIEDGKYYVMIRAVKGEETATSREDYYFGHDLLTNQHPVLQQFLTKELAKKEEIYKMLSKEGDKHQGRLKELEEEITLYKGGLKFYAL